jgi:hypothetical protein
MANKRSEMIMDKQTTNSVKDSGGPTVFMGAHIPVRLYRLLVEEAERAGVSRSEVLRWALARRYDRGKGSEQEDRRDDEK